MATPVIKPPAKQPTRVTKAHQRQLLEAAVVIRDQVNRYETKGHFDPLNLAILRDCADIILDISQIGVKNEKG